MEPRRPLLCLDFDGVIHSYTSGWKGADVIPDHPVPGAMDFIEQAAEYFTVAIYSSRSHQPGGIEAMRKWLLAFAAERNSPNQMPDCFNHIQWPTHKPSAFLTIDDRALTFTGRWPRIADLLAFMPWNKRGPSEKPAPSFARELEGLLNRHSVENGSNTPDFILAHFIRNALFAFDVATNDRDRWYRHERRPGTIKALTEPESVPLSRDTWHEDDGPVLWWQFPVREPPYCGTPLDDDWPGYHTHWTRIPIPAPSVWPVTRNESAT